MSPHDFQERVRLQDIEMYDGDQAGRRLTHFNPALAVLSLRPVRVAVGVLDVTSVTTSFCSNRITQV